MKRYRHPGSRRPRLAGKPIVDLTCPACGELADAGDGTADGTTPAVGDVAVCARCASALTVVTHGARRLVLREALPSELERLEPGDRAMLAIAQRAVEKHNKKPLIFN
jgi:hypothetical protein